MTSPHDTAGPALRAADRSYALISEQVRGPRVIDLSNPVPGPYPVIQVVREGRQLTFLCPYCRRNHFHGACINPEHYRRGVPCDCPRGAADGHRRAHCTSPASPFRLNGYLIEEVA